MTKRASPPQSLLARPDQPLIAVPMEVDGQEMVQYFIDEDALNSAEVIRRARALAGAWADLDWREMIEELDRIRHESAPTPPIDDL